MLCPYCGNELENDVDFCIRCGSKVISGNNYTNNSNALSILNDYNKLEKNRSFLKYIIFSVLTFGIYAIFFWHKYIIDLNIVCNDEKNNSPGILLVIIFSIFTFGIYNYYWLFKNANRIYYRGQSLIIPIKEDGTTILLWAIFISFLTLGIGYYVAEYFMINNLNKLIYRLKN